VPPAHTGIAMGKAGSDLELETADAVVVRDELATTPGVVALSPAKLIGCLPEIVRGMRVLATAGETYAGRLRDLGATVTAYGDGPMERVKAVHEGPVDLVFDTAPANGALPDLVRIAGGDPQRVLTCSDVAAAPQLGVCDSFHEDRATFTDEERFGFFPEFARLAADGRFGVPVSQTFPLDQWRTALEISLTARARGKLLLLPGARRGARA
jgi:NADPH:quinone reductase-like Zn-dependent oxidoreductase